MDFRFSEAAEALHRRILDGAREKLPASEAERLDLAMFRDRWRRSATLGMTGLSVPEAFGGSGLDALTTAHAVEAFAQGAADVGLSFAICAHLCACCMPIAEHGTEQAKRDLLPKLVSGEWIGANAITEPDAGSDVFALKTSVTRDGDDYLLSGKKSWVTNGPVADAFVVYGTIDPKAGFLGVTGFVVERDRPGVEVGAPIGKAVVECVPAGTLLLDRCRIPKQNLLGEEGQGAAAFTRSMQWERAVLFAGYLGMLDGQLERCIRYAKERRQFGRPIGKNQAISHQIADMKLRLDAARLLLYRACWLFDRGERSNLEIALSKVAVSEAAIASSLAAIQIHGSTGTTLEAGIERMLRDALPSTIFSGTSEIQRDIIARELGL